MFSLRRVTTTQAYLPFIDGLRFFSILAVVLVHFVDFYNAHTVEIIKSQFYEKLALRKVLGDSDNGVLIFFAISGFILGLPFAKSYSEGKPAPSLSSFYLRRVTRLEPPYLLILTALLLINVFVFKKSDFSETFPHYLASFFYLHNIIYEAYPELNFVFWSLEIEVQFYLLAPLFARIFVLRAVPRRLILFFGILILGLLNHYYKTPFISLFNYLQYFLAGFFALDLFLTENKKHLVFDLGFLAVFILVWTGTIKYGIALPYLIAALIYFSSVSLYWIKFLSLRWISLIGGMCYSIYMLHHPLMAAFMNRFLGNELILTNVPFDFFLKMGITLVLVFVVSAGFFIVIERPCMKKNWYGRIFPWKT